LLPDSEKQHYHYILETELSGVSKVWTKMNS